MRLTDREKCVLKFLYDAREFKCIDLGNILYHYEKHYDDDDCKKSLDSLIERQMVSVDLGCFYIITEKGIQYSLGG